MTTLKMNEYSNKQFELLKGRDIASIITSPFENGGYMKHYICEDGFEMWEQNTIIFENEDVEIDVHGLKVKKTIQIKLYQHECWSTKTPSVYAYEIIK